NALTGPGFFDLDASLLKVIKFKERYTLELRGEAFNITNTPQFSNPAAISPGATSATSRASPPAAAASTVSAAAAPSNSA
ncbi:MAG: hypothetical protein ACRD3Y_09270, partial [Bryobacteraceae bacterium]